MKLLLSLIILCLSGCIHDFGGLGENCYPNKTCNPGLICRETQYYGTCTK